MRADRRPVGQPHTAVSAVSGDRLTIAVDRRRSRPALALLHHLGLWLAWLLRPHSVAGGSADRSPEDDRSMVRRARPAVKTQISHRDGTARPERGAATAAGRTLIRSPAATRTAKMCASHRR
ncbi:hypothetical protein GCM10009530_20850 [Microbispora corallina]|uniref:Transposase n=1 Tax=Microbispora corallina TaxID=83302 RepID=A0ABQ4FTW3_9ACTN|nr:hypothetical protein Mco01_12550 [Microbispora corallina]